MRMSRMEAIREHDSLVDRYKEIRFVLGRGDEMLHIHHRLEDLASALTQAEAEAPRQDLTDRLIADLL